MSFPFLSPLGIGGELLLGTAMPRERGCAVSGEVLVDADQLAAVYEASSAVQRLMDSLMALEVRPTGDEIPGVPVDLVFMILQKWGDLAGAEHGLPADLRAMDAIKQKIPVGDLAREAAAVALAWVAAGARPALDLAVPS